LKYLKGTRVLSPSSSTLKGVQLITFVMVGLLTSFGLGVSFSHSAYASSYLTVSSGASGSVAFGSIRPTSSGTSATASDTLTVHTNCSVGYSVYVSGQNGKDTNLTNSNSSVTSNNTISTSSTAVGSTATALSSNTWGLNSTDSGVYVGLPAYANATNTALTSKSSVSEESTVPIYYGLKVDTSITPGTYTGDVLYTVLPDSACTVYTVRFNANGGTGSMNNQTITVGTATNLTMNSFTRSGYMFLGWSTDSSATTPTYKDGESVTDISGFNTTLDLYAIWGQSTGNMQEFQCTSLTPNTTTYLTDTRDNQVYSVYRWPTTGAAGTDYPTNMAGACLMTKDLSLGYVTGGSVTKGNDLTLTTADSNFDTNASNSSYETISLSGTQTVTARTGTSDWDTTNSYTNMQYINGPQTGKEEYSSHSYYSWGAALVVCPKGWRPLTDTERTNIVKLTGSDSIGSTAIRSAPYDFIQGGYFQSSGWVNVQVYGKYWTSTQYNSDSAYNLGFNLAQVSRGISEKYSGNSVRCIAQDSYTISYSSTGADSGSPSKTSEVAYENGSITTAAQGTMAKNGYNFLGWALISGATTATYSAEASVSISDLLSAASAAGQTTTSGSTITLYPVWEIAIDGDMQSWTGCSALSEGQQVVLRDTRDQRTYTVKKLPDGKCWMTQNLALGMDATTTGLTLTSSDTNIDNSTTYYLPPAGKQGSITSSSTLTSTTAANFSSSNDNYAKTQFRTKSSSYTNDSDTGYYNFYTATLGYSYYGSGSSGSSTRDICPKGWRLPKVTDGGTTVTSGSAAEFTTLAKSYNSSASWSGTSTSYSYYTSDSTIHTGFHNGVTADGNNYAGFSYSGFWNSTDSSASGLGSRGYYWSSSVYATGYGYYLDFDSSSVNPQYDGTKYYGRAVRCVAKEDTLQETSAANLAESTTTSLVDSRDNQSYTVYRWPSTGTAGTDYPTGMAGYAIMTKDLSLGYVTGGSITKGGNLSLTTSTSNFDTNASNSSYETISLSGTQTVTYVNSANNGTGWSTTNSYTNMQYTYGTATNSSHGYYSNGAALVVCPKGWRLPTRTEYSNIATFMGGSNSTGSSKIRGTPYNFVYGGRFYSSGWGNVGSNGDYWSSAQYSSAYGRYLYFGSSYLYTYNDSKNYGRSVRCVASP
ncbi:InlB B-repeat-containing protein, partial [Candidatus Saccharibacteria bacterium]|nr:InlB B-repeat-containing protein [Candidatus Saccharibacteria bacterium]